MNGKKDSKSENEVTQGIAGWRLFHYALVRTELPLLDDTVICTTTKIFQSHIILATENYRK